MYSISACRVQIVSALTDGADDGVTMPQEVERSWAWGYSLWARYNSKWGPGSNDGGAFMWLNGSGDLSSLSEYEDGTFDRLQAPRAYAVISALDHFSMADRAWVSIPREGDVECSLPRAEQVALVAQCAQAWLRTPLDRSSGGSVKRVLEETLPPGALVSAREDLYQS